MYKLKLVEGYKSSMTLRETEKAIKFTKDTFEKIFAKNMTLERISAPMFVASKSGVNDDLNGVERSVKFDILELDGKEAEIVHSLAKWKRMALKNYGFEKGEGLYTDMNAIRRDDNMDNIHSIYVDQWDWEKVIGVEDRTLDYLKKTVCTIVDTICETLDKVKSEFKTITTNLSSDVYFITAQELESLYPKKSPKEREYIVAKEHKTVFIIGIGDVLTSGEKHDGRAPDYDDWTLNGDLIFYNEVLDEQLEVSSMGIRVNKESLISQLEKCNNIDRLQYSYHRGIVDNILPLTIGGGIGQSRLCMLLLQKMHIGEVQVSMWPVSMLKECMEKGINIL